MNFSTDELNLRNDPIGTDQLRNQGPFGFCYIIKKVVFHFKFVWPLPPPPNIHGLDVAMYYDISLFNDTNIKRFILSYFEWSSWIVIKATTHS